MSKLEATLREEIGRLARKAARNVLSRTADEVRRLKKRVAELQVEIAGLKRSRAREISRSRMLEATQTVVSESVKKSRLSAGLIRKLRKRLKISQAEMAVLVDVSAGAVGFWETGKSQPRPDVRAKIVALRKLGRRDIQRLLAEKSAAPPKKPAKKVRRKKKARKRTARKK